MLLQTRTHAVWTGIWTNLTVYTLTDTFCYLSFYFALGVLIRTSLFVIDWYYTHNKSLKTVNKRHNKNRTFLKQNIKKLINYYNISILTSSEMSEYCIWCFLYGFMDNKNCGKNKQIKVVNKCFMALLYICLCRFYVFLKSYFFLRLVYMI